MKKICFILFNLLFAFMKLNAQYTEQLAADTVTIIQDDTRYTLPKTLAFQSKTIKVCSLLDSDQPIHINSDIVDMKAIIILMKSFDKHKTLSGKALLDAVENKNATRQFSMDVLKHCEFLGFKPGIHLLTRHLARKRLILRPLKNLININAEEEAKPQKKLSNGQLKKFAKYYFLLRGHNVSDIDPEDIGFSFNDYKDYRLADVTPKLRYHCLNLHFHDCVIVLKNFRLKKLHPRCFQDINDVKSVTYLDLENNKLRQLDPETFLGLNNLRELNLCSNQLRELNPRIFQPLHYLRELHLKGNPLSPENIKLLQDSLPHVKIIT